MAVYQIIGIIGYCFVIGIVFFLILKFIRAQESMAKSLEEISRYIKSLTVKDKLKD